MSTTNGVEPGKICPHKNINYSNPPICADCGAEVGEGIKILDKLTPAQLAAASRAGAGLRIASAGRRNRKTPKAAPKRIKIVVEAEGIPGVPLETPDVPVTAKAVSRPKDEEKKDKTAITRLDVSTEKERVWETNGVKFFCSVNEKGFRTITACHETEAKLRGALIMLMRQGYVGDVKKEAGMFLLTVKEKKPSGKFKNEDEAK